MDSGQSLFIPSLFDSTNYAYQKVHMNAFLQALDEKYWLAIKVDWKKPSELPITWNDEKIKKANFNSRALNALYIGVANEEFIKISSIEIAKEAWTILDTIYEGTQTVKTIKI